MRENKYNLSNTMNGKSKTKYYLNRRDYGNFLLPPLLADDSERIKVAFFNFKASFITDQSEMLRNFPQYAWDKRKGPTLSLIKNDNPDILGFCELSYSQICYLNKFLKEKYHFIGCNPVNYESFTSVEEVKLSKESFESGEFVGVFFKKNRIKLIKVIFHQLRPNKKCNNTSNKVLVEVEFQESITKTNFTTFVSHFDSQSLTSRKEAGYYERSCIQTVEQSNQPWFSLGDRNWFPDQEGELCAFEYIQTPWISDFRDYTELGHFGPAGTFPGHLGLEIKFQPPMQVIDGKFTIIDANTLDVNFYAINQIKSICSFSYTGEFDKDTYELIPSAILALPSEKNFISDHYYIGGIFEFKK